MKPWKDKDSEESPRELIVRLVGGGRCEMKAAVRMALLDEAEEKRFDAEIENLLRELIRQQRKET